MRALSWLALAALGLGAGCGDPNLLPPATFPNVVDTLTLHAVRGTPIHQPSGFAISTRRPVRLDIPVNLDFVFDLNDQGQPVFIPLAALGASASTFNPGFLKTSLPFDSITVAEVNGYVTADTVPIAPGERYYMRSRIDTGGCFLGLPFYGKLEVLSVDPDARTVRFRALVDVNCGYRGLLPGLPSR